MVTIKDEEISVPKIIPNPDPSEQTTFMMDRSIGHLQEILKTRFEMLETRLDAMDKAATMLHDDMVRVPTLLDREIKSSREIMENKLSNIDNTKTAQHVHIIDTMNEKFARVDVLFVEGDKRTQQLSTANALALAAALQAAKEAVAEQNRSNTTAISKSEMAVGESIKQLQVAFQAANQATNEKVDDIKSRLDKREGEFGNNIGYQNANRGDTGNIINIVIAGAAVIAIIVSIYAAIHSSPQPVYQASPSTTYQAPALAPPAPH